MERLAVAKEHLKEAVHAVVHPHTICEGVDHLLEELAKIEKEGGEGLMLRKVKASHRGGRSTDLLKVRIYIIELCTFRNRHNNNVYAIIIFLIFKGEIFP